jgi:ribonucleoside-triphosphate reductase
MRTIIDYSLCDGGEIILRPFGFCNLTEVVVRADDTSESLVRKVRLASLLGTFQSTLTDFRYIRKQWKINAEEERLLGVSLTGIMDNPILNGSDTSVGLGGILDDLKMEAIRSNEEWAGRLGINPSVAITTVKPSGTVSQLVDSASGIHPRHNPYYIRTVRADVKDPLAIFMQEKGVPYEVDVTNASNLVFSFPVEAPSGSVVRSDRGAIEQLDHYLTFKRHWCEHNPSITVYVKEDEWLDVGAWVYKHLDEIGGVSFLPHSEHVYKQAPYQDISAEEYKELSEAFPVVPWTEFDKYETDEDTTNGAQEFACTSGSCEIL